MTERKGQSLPKSSEILLPELPKCAYGRPEGKRYKPQFGVIVLAQDETEQKALFVAIKAQGYKCRVVNT